RTRIVRIGLVTLLVLAAALLPRVLGLADFFTIDKADHWILRVRLFSEALGHHNWAGTNLTGHPGVMTMWLGSLGRLLAIANRIAPSSDSADYLAMLRLPLAVTNSLAVALGYLLLRRIVRPGIALLAAILWATEPFLIAHSRLLHVDALMTSFSTICVLLLLLGSPLRAGQPPARAAGWRLSARGSWPGWRCSARYRGWCCCPGPACSWPLPSCSIRSCAWRTARAGGARSAGGWRPRGARCCRISCGLAA
nr:glycosyltransferase family 39 protein [Chloroflexota bacterium]